MDLKNMNSIDLDVSIVTYVEIKSSYCVNTGRRDSLFNFAHFFLLDMQRQANDNAFIYGTSFVQAISRLFYDSSALRTRSNK